jgi:hypothetical protein
VNNDALLPSLAGLTIGLILVVVAANRSANPPRPGAQRRAAAMALLMYAVIAVPYFVWGGMTLPWLLILLGLTCLPLLAASLGSRRRVDTTSATENAASALVAVGLATLMLIAAAQTVSLLTRVDPRTLVVVLAFVVGVITGLQGLAAAGRIGSTATWVLIFPIAISLALGLLLGGFGEVVDPIVPVGGPSAPEILAVSVAVFALAWADPGTGALMRPFRGQRRPLLIIAACALSIVLLLALGQLMFLGGSVLAPSMQFFVLPANLDILPALIAVALTALIMVFAALIAVPLAGAADIGGGRWVAGAAGLSAVIALIDPGAEGVLTGTMLVAAAIMGVNLRGGSGDRGIGVGLAVAAIAFGILSVTGSAEAGIASLVAAAVVALVAALTTAKAPIEAKD